MISYFHSNYILYPQPSPQFYLLSLSTKHYSDDLSIFNSFLKFMSSNIYIYTSPDTSYNSISSAFKRSIKMTFEWMDTFIILGLGIGKIWTTSNTNLSYQCSRFLSESKSKSTIDILIILPLGSTLHSR